MKQEYVLEVAIFTVKADYQGDMPALRAGLREALKGFAGLLEFCAYRPVHEGNIFADIAKWDSLESATAAADAFAAGDPRFAPYMQAIDSLVFMGHFSPETVI
jgi:hypothetical protein